jgi:hypothetical protein
MKIKYTGPLGEGVTLVVAIGVEVAFPPGEPVDVPDHVANMLVGRDDFVVVKEKRDA